MVKCTKCDATLIEAEQGQELCIKCVKDSDTGLRYNEGKLPYDLIPFEAEEGLARVLAHGAKKYAARNWEKGMDWSIPYGAMRRHQAAWWNGEKIDKESGLPHMAHILCNAAFLLAYEQRQVGTDDRPVELPKSSAAKIEDGLKDPKAVQRLAETPLGFKKQVSCENCGVEITSIYGETVLPSVLATAGGIEIRICLQCSNVLAGTTFRGGR